MTENARRAIYFARADALEAGADSIAPGHIARALLRECWFPSEILKDVSDEELRRTITAHLPAQKNPRRDFDIPLKDASKRTLAYAVLEADAALDSHIGNEHLWLGLLREEQQSKTVIVGLSKHPGIKNIRARIRHVPREVREKDGRTHALRTPVLQGKAIRLEPLSHDHVEALAAAAGFDPSLYKWSPVPQGKDEATKYVKAALAWQDEGTSVSFAIVRLGSNGEAETVVGSTRFWNIERWDWPHGHSRHMRSQPDACEIGYTWLASSAIRTAANTEAKLLMLTYAFETWQVLRVCFHTDARNQRSRAALERIGAKFEGILRAHRMAADFISRDSLRFSIVAEEWPEVKTNLQKLLDRR